MSIRWHGIANETRSPVTDGRRICCLPAFPASHKYTTMLNPTPPHRDEWMRHMRAGDWEAAWQLSDRVIDLHQGQRCQGLPQYLQPVWNGRPLAGQRLLVRC